jgi:hypothetical protein
MARLTASVVTAAVLALPQGAAATTISPDRTAANVNAYGGLVVWTRTTEDAEGLATYRLVARTPDGLVRDLALRGFAHQVDADLGPAPDGGIVAVYDRCRVGACDVWEYSFVSGRERRVASISTRRRAESAASVWEGRYSFLRYAITIGFHAGFRGAGVYGGPPPRRGARQLADQTDRQEGAVAYSTGSRRAPSAVSRVNVLRGAGRRARVCRVALAGRGQGLRVREPALSDAYVYWLHVVVDASGTEFAALRRTPIPGRRCASRGPVEEHAGALPRGTRSLAVDGPRAFVTAGQGVVELDAPAFAAL